MFKLTHTKNSVFIVDSIFPMAVGLQAALPAGHAVLCRVVAHGFADESVARLRGDAAALPMMMAITMRR